MTDDKDTREYEYKRASDRDLSRDPGSLGDPYDRRGANRESIDWVRKALADNRMALEETKITVLHIEKNLEALTKELQARSEMHLNAIPNRDPIGHLNDHLDWIRERKERNEAQEEAKKFKKDLWQSAVKYMLGAIGMSLVAMFLLGAQTQLRVWVLGPPTGSITVPKGE